jgi:hypothetical protein
MLIESRGAGAPLELHRLQRVVAVPRRPVEIPRSCSTQSLAVHAMRGRRPGVDDPGPYLFIGVDLERGGVVCYR